MPVTNNRPLQSYCARHNSVAQVQKMLIYRQVNSALLPLRALFCHCSRRFSITC